MPLFDYASVLATGLIILAFVSVLVFFVTAKRGDGRLLLWSLANLLFMGSRVAFAAQPELPPVIGVIGANALAYVSLVAYASASLVLLSGRPPWIFLGILGGFCLAFLAVFTWPFPDSLARVEFMSAATALAALVCGIRLFRAGRRAALPRYPALLAGLFITYAVFFAARAAWYLATGHGADPRPFMPRDFFFSLETFFSTSLIIVLNFVLLALLMARLEREITAKVLEIGESRNELQILYDAFLETAGTVGLDELVPKILDLVINGLHAKTAALNLLDPVSGELTLLAQRGYDAESFAVLMRPPKGTSVASEAFERQASVVWTIADYPAGPARDTMARQGVAIVGGFPISARGEALGSLTIGYAAESSLDAAREALLGSLSLQLGIVVRSARLLEELDRANARLDLLASTDSLTGLANRRTAERELVRETARALRSHGELAVIMCDIDHFKDFNDRWGHDCGDYVLAGTAALIQETVRATDHAARWGGEEFLVVLGEADADGVLALAERIRSKVEAARWSYEGQELSVTLTLGAAVCPPEAGGDAAVAAADEALYEGKRAGRNRVVLKRPAARRPGEDNARPCDGDAELIPCDEE